MTLPVIFFSWVGGSSEAYQTSWASAIIPPQITLTPALLFLIIILLLLRYQLSFGLKYQQQSLQLHRTILDCLHKNEACSDALQWQAFVVPVAVQALKKSEHQNQHNFQVFKDPLRYYICVPRTMTHRPLTNTEALQLSGTAHILQDPWFSP